MLFRYFWLAALVGLPPAGAQLLAPIPAEAPPMLGKSPAWRMQYLFDEDDAELVLNDFAAVSPTHLVAGGYLHVKGKVKPLALVSNDGGQNWRRVEVKEPVLSLYFLDQSRGWLVTTKHLYATLEGGLQWKRVAKIPQGMERVVFRTAQEGWTFGLGKTFYKTVNGGSIWTKVPEGEELKLTDENTAFRWMEFVDQRRGLLVGNSQPRRPHDRDVPDWFAPETALRRRQLPGSLVVLETADAGQTWSSQVRSILGTVTRLRFAGDQGLAVFNYTDQFDWPSEVIRLDLKTRTNAPFFRQKDRNVTDVAATKDGAVYLAAIEATRLRSSPVPGKLHIIRVKNLKDWNEMAVDYRAVGRRAFLSAYGDSVWVATDQGMVLKLSD